MRQNASQPQVPFYLPLSPTGVIRSPTGVIFYPLQVRLAPASANDFLNHSGRYGGEAITHPLIFPALLLRFQPQSCLAECSFICRGQGRRCTQNGSSAAVQVVQVTPQPLENKPCSKTKICISSKRHAVWPPASLPNPNRAAATCPLHPFLSAA